MDRQESMRDPIRILIVEDHPLFGQGLRRILEHEPDLQVIGEVADGVDAVSQAMILQPDVILMDINLPGQNGLESTRRIKKSAVGDATAIIILTAYHDDEQLYHALQAGAAAYYPKDVLPSRLLSAIHAVAAGKFVIDDQAMKEPQVARWLLRRLETMASTAEVPDDLYRPLSAREMDILRCLTQGASNKEMARALHISPQTVKNHMSNVLRKLDVDDRTQAAVLALRRGWIRLEETASR